MRFHIKLGTLTALLLRLVGAIELDVNDLASIKSAAQTAAGGVMGYYNITRTYGAIGIFDEPYYWWEAGAVWGAMIDYWYLTGDDQYNDVVSQALLFQIGPNADYMPPNQTRTLGNDDQAFWALAALSAAERSFPRPPSGQPQWLDLARAVFDTQAARWNTETCGGGLNWQIFTFNNGYYYKNSISTGMFFQLAARLYQYTGNQTYADWAETAYEWATSIKLIAEHRIYDGADDTINCTEINHIQWSANAGIFLYGSAIMYNMTSSDKWRTTTDSLLRTNLPIFTSNPEDDPAATSGVIYEVACERNDKCNIDQRAYKGLFARWLSRTAIAAPFTADAIYPLLSSSAQAAAALCDPECQGAWYRPAGDGNVDLSTQLSALEAIQANLVPQAGALASANTTTAGSSDGTSTALSGSQGTASGTGASVAVQTGAAPGTAICGVVAVSVVASLAIAALL